MSNIIMNKLPSFLALFTVILVIMACGSSATPTQEPTKPEPTAVLSAPSNTPKAPPIATETSTKAPAETLQPSPVPTETTGIPEIGSDRFRLTDPPMEDERIGQMKFRLMELGYLYGPSGCPIIGSIYTHATDAAILLFQETNGLEVDGIVGPITWGTLFGVDALPAPIPDVPFIEVNPWQEVMPGKVFVMTARQNWSMDDSGMFTAFLPNGEFDGFYMVEPLPGEEVYMPAAIWFDGAYFWIAQQGAGDALVQAYDPGKASPVEGLLKPVFDRSIHFPASALYIAAASDGKTLWLLTEDYPNGHVMLQPIDLPSRTAGTPFRIGKSSGYSLSYSLAYDAASGDLWMVYGDEIFGEGIVLKIDPAGREVGSALPFCGRQVANDGQTLWVAGENQLMAVDPADGKLKAQAPVSGWITALHMRGDELWVMTDDGTLYKVENE